MDSKNVLEDIYEQLHSIATSDIGDYVDRETGNYKNFFKWTKKMRLAVKDFKRDHSGNVVSVVFHDKKSALEMLCKFGSVGAFRKGAEEDKMRKIGDILDRNRNMRLVNKS